MFNYNESSNLVTRMENILRAADLTLDDLTIIHPSLLTRLRGWGRKTHYCALQTLERMGKEPGVWRNDTIGKGHEQLSYYMNHRREIRAMVEAERGERAAPDMPSAPATDADDAFRREAALRILCAIIDNASAFSLLEIRESWESTMVHNAVYMADELIKDLKNGNH